MAIGKKTGGKNFEKGHHFSSGRPKLPDDLKAVNLLNKGDIKRIIFKYLEMTPNELTELSQNTNDTKAVDLIIIKFIADAIRGDHYKAEWLLQRSIGRVSEEPEDTGETAHSKLLSYLNKRSE